MIIIMNFLSGCKDDNLLLNLTQEQATQVLATLQQYNISARKEGTIKTGYNIIVDPSDTTTALSIINQYQLPWPAEVQISQAFPDGALVDSPNAEKSRVLSLQEQRLEQSIRLIYPIVNARVHVSYPSFTEGDESSKLTQHVSVLISYKGEIDDSIFIAQIKSLIKNSFDDVQYANISVILFPAQSVHHYSTPKTQDPNLPMWTIIFVILVILIVLLITCFLYVIKKQLSIKKVITSPTIK